MKGDCSGAKKSRLLWVIDRDPDEIMPFALQPKVGQGVLLPSPASAKHCLWVVWVPKREMKNANFCGELLSLKIRQMFSPRNRANAGAWKTTSRLVVLALKLGLTLGARYDFIPDPTKLNPSPKFSRSHLNPDCRVSHSLQQ